MYLYKISLSTVLIALVALQKSIAVDDHTFSHIKYQITEDLKIVHDEHTVDLHYAIQYLNELSKEELVKEMFQILDASYFSHYYKKSVDNSFHLPIHQDFSLIVHSSNETIIMPICDIDQRRQITNNNLQLRI